MERSPTGRFVFMANEEGVNYRIGVLVAYLATHRDAPKTDLVDLLLSIHRSYNENDLAQPIRQMIRLEIILVSGSGLGATYRLTPKGRAIWSKIVRKWV